MISAKIITIGDEILIGQIVDTNSTFISKQLINIGIEVSEILSISDEKESILNALNNSLNKFDIVITTGGLGPTNDDITKEVFCEFFNDKLVHNQDLLLHIENLFKKFANNPINDLIYGYGAVKLFPKKNLLATKEFKVDMTTSIGAKFKPKFEISNTTQFNTDPFNAWRSAFRECTKLSSNIIDHNKQIDDSYRLEVWCTRGENRRYGEYAILGAQQGRDFGTHYRNNTDALRKINDWNWLKEKFNEAL